MGLSGTGTGWTEQRSRSSNYVHHRDITVHISSAQLSSTNYALIIDNTYVRIDNTYISICLCIHTSRL